MEQAQFVPCPDCQAPNPPGHKFCGRCGTTLKKEYQELTTELFSSLQEPEKANLIVIRGEPLEGTRFQLRASAHELGRTAEIKVADPTLSDCHARFEYLKNQLIVSDQNSLNGIYKRIEQSIKLQEGDCFSIGDQVFVIDEAPVFQEEADEEATTFYGSPFIESPLRVTQVLMGGSKGLSFCPTTTKLNIGRCACDINIYDDPHISREHCSLEKDADGYSLHDLNSANGTFVKVQSPIALAHGDYLKLGRTLLRVEFNA